MFASERKQKIIEILEQTPAVRVAELSDLFQVSEVTIRRDLQELEAAGLLKRTHGGAVSIATASFEPTLTEKEEEHLAEKKAIAQAAINLIADGDTILLDAGSTTLQLARLLKANKKHPLTVVTNALNVAWELAFIETIDLILTGGHLRHSTLSSVGPIADNTLQGLYVDKVFLATNGLDVERGLTTPNIYEAQTKQKMVKAGREVIVLADHSKFGRISLGLICPVTAVNRVITDPGAPVEDLERLKERGVEVIVAGGN
ncbi:MAG: DeoR family transcriptional regulator, fructose operon transcriptional repressor [Moorella sp. (in: firmicutes)]|jgi:DeoR family fructose operon transcriptional repressor|uniref:DeoR/GlpR family DNA-binding transcription regulator n=1 Tax=unclassified Neomoorella TaxID=2676739 RepID=UPI0010FFBBA2|nr:MULTISPECIES: DeoR/GlpR family DNA-binding transcription regulator [unclassified Moorella (in: firmicutes)]MDK2817323.1 DeoR family transcriptional regulator, fructose operon transcriptional repressor [Moorella sp. (in: firmicutes)]GEA14473.1 DeoR family transcriptional regulator [Moorella sp. E308F]GEA18155.1 DeoR family transcriptional regulator [Moorella sp. E306M]